MSTSGNDPFAGLPEALTFTVTSTTLAEGAAMPVEQLSGIAGVPGGKDISPQLTWSGAPAGTKSYAVTSTTRMRPPAPASGTGR